MSRKERIIRALTEGLAPLHLEVLDESRLHSVPEGSESHFLLVVVSDAFATENLVGRHRRVNALLREEFQSGLHAVAVHTWTSEEWFDRGGLVPESPQCEGGSKAP